ncbi:hypothetical protein AG0111_0g3455 [Alternaria gaisen]|uniref:Uncharacterized protein n=1 Tax=Alternaria gaisen TaxID=167740 RepID=A0ACB6FVG8_9PLEO|nr:hypothetical protein AG0111_0g3455 [Alternaria gaisen]
MALSDNHSVRMYAYEALESPKHIRLIALHPALSKDAPLKISFFSSILDNVVGSYDAISYTWGQPILTFALHVNDGTQVCVTENLDRVLRCLRRTDRDRLLWADAASINQRDKKEKAVQIPLMVQIFRNARRVMAWLDPGGDTTAEQKGMRVMDRLSRNPPIQKETLGADYSNVFRFLNLPWFKRLWIVQEVVFNVEICLICGDTELPFSRFITALSIMGGKFDIIEDVIELNADDKANWHAIATIKDLWDTHSLFSGQYNRRDNPIRIWNLVDTFGLYGCTDPRDRIFALYSMATDVRPSPRRLSEKSPQTEDHSSTSNGSVLYDDDPVYMDIDYALDAMEIYKTFMRAVIRANGFNGNPILGALLARQYSPRPVSWPSWVPDWQVVPRRGTIVPLGPSVHVDFELHPTNAGIVRMNVPKDKHPKIKWDDDYYAIISKTSRRANNCGTSFLSQLLQLYALLQKTAPQETEYPRELETLSSPVILAQILRHLVFACGKGPSYWNELFHLFNTSDEDSGSEDIISELTQYFAKMMTVSDADDLVYSTTASSAPIQDFIDRLEKLLGDTVDLFCFHDQGLGKNSVGFGNVALELGDYILPISGLAHAQFNSSKLTEALILRRTYPMEEVDGEERIYRLVGSGYIYDPFFLLMHDSSMKHQKDMEDKYKNLKWEIGIPDQRWQKNFFSSNEGGSRHLPIGDLFRENHVLNLA